MTKRSAFTMIELIFVIVVMGILAKFGVELLKRTTEGYVRSMHYNDLQTKSANAIQTLANRLSYRIKDSIRSTTIGATTVTWVGMDIDGWLANRWSGIIDVDSSSLSSLVSPGLQNSATGTQIYFIGSDVNNSARYVDVTVNAGNFTGSFGSVSGVGSGMDVYEYYQMVEGTHTLQLSGTQLQLDGIPLVDDVSDFLVEKLGDGLHIHLCLAKKDNPLLEGQVCKDKFVF